MYGLIYHLLGNGCNEAWPVNLAASSDPCRVMCGHSRSEFVVTSILKKTFCDMEIKPEPCDVCVCVCCHA